MPSSTIADHLLSADAQLRNSAVKDAIELIAKNQWSVDIGHGCNLFHFIAFIPTKYLDNFLPDWKERLNNALTHDDNKAFDKENDVVAVTEASSHSPKGQIIPAFNKDTPLGIALFRGNHEVAKILMEHGADITHRNATGNTILHLAAATGAGILIDKLCNQLPIASFEAKTNTGKTPLDQAKRYGNTDAVQKLQRTYAAPKDRILEKWVNRNTQAENQASNTRPSL